MPLRPDPIPAMMRMLRDSEAVVALCADRIYGGKVPSLVVDTMPINTVVLQRAGGVQDHPDLPMNSYRIQATCYGGGQEPDSSDEVQASLVSSAVADAFLHEGSFYYENTVIKSITFVGGPTQVADIDMNDTVAEVLFFRVFMPTIALVAPY